VDIELINEYSGRRARRTNWALHKDHKIPFEKFLKHCYLLLVLPLELMMLLHLVDFPL
jgi:hypothetical protein